MDMPKHLNLRLFVIGCALLQWPAVSHATECVLFSKRAPVSAVCGRVINGAGEQLNEVDLSLTSETDSVIFEVKSDAEGKFSFKSVPKGDYALRAAASGYRNAVRQIRVTQGNKSCSTGKITVTLGFDGCDTGVRVKGVDKLSDLHWPGNSKQPSTEK